MKKTYLIPNCKYAEIESFELCVISGGGTTDLNQDPIESEGDIKARENNSLWDAEW